MSQDSKKPAANRASKNMQPQPCPKAEAIAPLMAMYKIAKAERWPAAAKALREVIYRVEAETF